MSISEDLVFKILLWMPIRSLFQCKSVCKSWYHLIQTPEFINQHKSHSQLSPPKSKYKVDLLFMNSVDDELKFSLLSGENYQISHDLSNCFGSFVRDNINLCTLQLVASCNGIVCLNHQDYRRDVFLWNPITQQCNILPESPIPLPGGDTEIEIAFTFDVKTNDYKVIRFIFENYYGTLRVEIYNLSTNSWRDVTCDTYVDSYMLHPRATYRSGVYFWLQRRIVHGVVGREWHWKYHILTFDVSKEVFGNMPLPDDYTFRVDMKSDLGLDLAILRDQLMCLDWMSSLEKRNFDFKVWVLNDYGVDSCWKELCTVQLGIGSFVRVVGSSSNGIIVSYRKKCLCDDKCQCGEELETCLFDPMTQETINLPVEVPNLHLQVIEHKNGTFIAS